MGTKSWLRLDLHALSKAAGTNLGELTQGSSNDPTQALAFLKGASSDAKEIGREQVRGADTTHYNVTIDLRKAAQQQGAEARKRLDQLLEQMELFDFGTTAKVQPPPASQVAGFPELLRTMQGRSSG